MWIFRKRNIAPVIFILCIYLSKIGSKRHGSKSHDSQQQSEEVACESESIKSDNGYIHMWKTKYRNDLTPYATSSSGTCLKNSTNELLVRKCDPMTGQWSPQAASISCANIQKQHNVFCPEDLIEISIHDEFICLKLTDDARIFDETFCYGSDTLLDENSMKPFEMEAILKYLNKQKKIKRFWMPIRRATYNKYYNPFVVRLPGFKWGDVYEIPTQLPISLKELFVDKHCLSAEIVDVNKQLSIRSEMTNCSEALPIVCIFRKEFVAYAGCPQGFGALAHKPNECFGIDWEADLFPYDLRSISIDEYYKRRNTLHHIFYSLALEEEDFFLIGNFSDHNKQHFSIEMNSNEEFRIVPYNGRRHALSYERLTTQNRKSVEMVLSINAKIGSLVLTIYNRNYIWRFSDKDDNYGIKCFTNSQADEVQWKTVKIKLLWQNTLETKAMFELKHSDNDGYYWCEAHTIFEFSMVKTEKIAVPHAQKKGHTYALLLELNCEDIECHNLYAENTWKSLSKKSKKLLNKLINERRRYKQKFEELEITNVRLMDIADIFNNHTTLRCLIHVSALLRSTSIHQDSEDSSEEWGSKESDFSLATTVRLKILELLTALTALINKSTSVAVRSTTFCFPATFYMANKEENFWQLSKHGQTATTAKLCLQENGLPIIRSCLGDFLWGAYWEAGHNYENSLQCYRRKPTDVITYELRELYSKRLSKTSPEKAVKNVRNLLEHHNMKKLIPADFYYISRIMHTTMKSLLRMFNLNANTNEAIAIEIARIYNYLMEVNEHIVKSSALLNSTNVLLEVFERLIDEMALEINQTKIPLRNNSSTSSAISANYTNEMSEIFFDAIKTLNFEDIGVIVKIANNFVIFMLDPNVANITGVALYHNEDNNSIEKNNNVAGSLAGAFKNETYRFIMANQSVDDLLYETALQLATYIPASLWQRLDEISKIANLTIENLSTTRIVIKIYANDILFQETVKTQTNYNNSDKIVAGKIISVSIPGHDKDLPEMLPLIFKIPKNVRAVNETTISCSYWNYDNWVDDGLNYLGHSAIDPSIILCGCTHLTPFAYLLVGSSFKMSIDPATVFIVETHEKVLDVITILGCSLSIFGTIGIFVTAVTFQSWRQKASSKVLLQLAAAISLQMLLFCFVNTAENSQQLMEHNIFSSCIAIGALLHYSVLVQFSWMLIIGYLQFKRYVQVFGNTRPTRFFKKSSIIGWGAPLIPVILVLIFDRKSYIPEYSVNGYTQSICYPTGYSLYIAVIFPITLIIIANFIIFSIIVHNILRGPEGTLRHTEKGLALSQLRLSVLLFFLLGFTWIFGLLASLRAGIIFSYLFCLTATLQGFVIFIYFVILDPKTRRMWSGFFYNLCGLKENYENSSSTKDMTQTLR